jgi:hypothetical protein
MDGGIISHNRHITAGIHSQIGTQSGGEHLNKEESFHFEDHILEPNNLDDKFILLLLILEYGLSAFASGSSLIYIF